MITPNGAENVSFLAFSGVAHKLCGEPLLCLALYICQAIACTPDCLQYVVSVVGFEIFANSQNVYIYSSFLNIGAGPPDVVQQLSATVNTIGVLHKKCQQLEFCMPEIHLLVIHEHPMRSIIKQLHSHQHQHPDHW